MSCAWRDLRRTARPKPTSGSTITGMAPSTNSDSRGLVTTIMAAPPTNSTRLRSAIDTEAPTADLIWVVSAVSREVSLAGLGGVEERRRQPRQMREHVAAQIGDDALAQCGDEVVAQRARGREHRHHADHHREIAVDQHGRLLGKAEIDHAAHGDRHDQRGRRGDDQRGERGDGAALVAADIGQRAGPAGEASAGVFRRPARLLRQAPVHRSQNSWKAPCLVQVSAACRPGRHPV